MKFNSHKKPRTNKDKESIHALPFEYDPTELKENEGYFYTRGMEIFMLNTYAQACHAANRKWWTDLKTDEYPIKRNVGELLMLCVSELSEAMEGHRKDLQDDKLPNRKMFDVELVDCLIRIFDIAAAFNVDLDSIYTEKMEFNRTRIDHSKIARLAEGGKKY